MRVVPPTEARSVVVFTAQFGRSDVIMPPEHRVPGVEYLVLTDDVERVPGPWRIRRVTVPTAVTNPRLKNRWCKLHASELLADFDVSIYVDAHIQITGDLQPVIDEFLASGATLGVLRHPHSNSVREEVSRSLRTGRITQEDHDANWLLQMERQRVRGFVDDVGVYYPTIFIRRHRGELLAELEEAWWQELSAGVLRDQVALPFALWSTGVPHQVFLLPWTLDPFFRRWPHLPRWTLRERVLRHLDCRVATRPSYRWILRALRPRDAVRSLLKARSARDSERRTG